MTTKETRTTKKDTSNLFNGKIKRNIKNALGLTPDIKINIKSRKKKKSKNRGNRKRIKKEKNQGRLHQSMKNTK